MRERRNSTNKSANSSNRFYLVLKVKLIPFMIHRFYIFHYQSVQGIKSTNQGKLWTKKLVNYLNNNRWRYILKSIENWTVSIINQLFDMIKNVRFVSSRGYKFGKILSKFRSLIALNPCCQWNCTCDWNNYTYK